MSIYTIALIIVAFFFVCWIVYSIIVSYQKNSMDNHLKQASGFSMTHKYLAPDGSSGIGIDEIHKSINLVKYVSGQGSVSRLVKYEDILSVEVSEDNVPLMRSTRTRAAWKSMENGLAMGGVDKLVGETSSSPNQGGTVKNISLRLVINDDHDPTHDVSFLEFQSKRGDSEHQASMHQARHWYALVATLIKQTDSELESQHKNQ